jgi:hypothetical protein
MRVSPELRPGKAYQAVFQSDAIKGVLLAKVTSLGIETPLGVLERGQVERGAAALRDLTTALQKHLDKVGLKYFSCVHLTRHAGRQQERSSR